MKTLFVVLAALAASSAALAAPLWILRVCTRTPRRPPREWAAQARWYAAAETNVSIWLPENVPV